MWTVWIVSTVIDSTEPKYTRYAEVEHFETCEHVARDLEAEFTQDEYVVCEGTEQWKYETVILIQFDVLHRWEDHRRPKGMRVYA